MEEIIIETVRLIAADKESDSIINQLRSDGIFFLDNSPCVLLNIVLVSTKEGSQKVSQLLALNEKAKKNVAILMNSELQILEKANIDSVLSFSDELGFYENFKNFLLLIRHYVELHEKPLCFDFIDFFWMIKGRRDLAIHSYRYKEKITEAVSNLRSIPLLKDARYLLFFTIDYEQEQSVEQLYTIKNYMDEFPDDAYIHWHFMESESKEVILFVSKQI